MANDSGRRIQWPDAPLIDPYGRRPSRLTLLVLILGPPIVLFSYSVLSLFLFFYSSGFRDLVAVVPDRYPWLIEVFPALRFVPQVLTAKSAFFSVGYIHHLYLAALAVFVANLAINVIGFPVIHRAMAAGIGRDARYRKRFKDSADAMMKIALAVSCTALVVVAFSKGWLWSLESRKLYAWDRDFFPLIELPLCFGVLPSMVLCGVQILLVVLSPSARTFQWGADAVREETALKARSEDRR